MAWAGTGLIWTLSGGILSWCTFSQAAGQPERLVKADFSFAQISDSHIGFNNVPNTDVIGTFQRGVARISALSYLRRFGSVQGLRSADPGDIAAAVGPITARAVAEYLKHTA